ncbi:hypothetical protein AB0284_20420 [Pseudarthrobacter phenanthrenivorans]
MQLGPVKVYRKDGTVKTVMIKRLGLRETSQRHPFVFVAGYFRD